jgi:DNA-binding response OmpR family regulator
VAAAGVAGRPVMTNIVGVMADKPKVLIVDDDEQFALLMASHLRGAGYQPVTAVDAMQGFMFALRESPALILLDISMPAGGGMSLLGRLGKAVRTQLIPVVVITARQESDVETEARSNGAIAFLRKPIDRDTLLATIGAALKSP